MDLNKLIKEVELKTGEKIVSVTSKKPKISKLHRFLCFLGFHNFDIKSGNGFFTDNQCTRCLKIRTSNI